MLHKLYKNKINSSGLFIVSLLAIIALFTLLQPKIHAVVFPNREHKLEKLVSEIKNNNGIHYPTLWEQREFYDNGYFLFDREGIKSEEINLSAFPASQSAITKTLFKYNAPHWISYEGITKSSSLNTFISDLPSDAQVLFRDESSVVYSQGDKTKIIFLKPITDIEKGNGFFDYREHDKKLLENNYWFSFSEISK